VVRVCDMESEYYILDELYRRVSDIIDVLDEAKRIVSEKFNVHESWMNPFDTYKAQRAVEEIRNDLVDFLLRQITKDINVPVDRDEVVKFLDETVGKLGFSSAFIVNFVKAKYLSRADELAYNHIIEKAKGMIPIFYTEYERRDATLDDIVKGRVLILKTYVDWGFTFPSKRYLLEGLYGLEKLIMIVCRGEAPSTVKANFISSIYYNASTHEDLTAKYEIENDVVEAIKLFKNRKVKIWFKRREDAVKVAQALLA